MEIPDDVVEEYIANHVKNNIRQLEGVVKKLNAYNKLAQTPPSILLAQSAIREILTDNQPIPVTVERIISEVGRTFGVSPEDIRSTKRSAQISNARQIAMYVIREITQMSMAAIGKEFGGRDHSTVVYANQPGRQKYEAGHQIQGNSGGHHQKYPRFLKRNGAVFVVQNRPVFCVPLSGKFLPFAVLPSFSPVPFAFHIPPFSTSFDPLADPPSLCPKSSTGF